MPPPMTRKSTDSAEERDDEEAIVWPSWVIFARLATQGHLFWAHALQKRYKIHLNSHADCLKAEAH